MANQPPSTELLTVTTKFLHQQRNIPGVLEVVDVLMKEQCTFSPHVQQAILQAIRSLLLAGNDIGVVTGIRLVRSRGFWSGTRLNVAIESDAADDDDEDDDDGIVEDKNEKDMDKDYKPDGAGPTDAAGKRKAAKNEKANKKNEKGESGTKAVAKASKPKQTRGGHPNRNKPTAARKPMKKQLWPGNLTLLAVTSDVNARDLLMNTQNYMITESAASEDTIKRIMAFIAPIFSVDSASRLEDRLAQMSFDKTIVDGVNSEHSDELLRRLGISALGNLRSALAEDAYINSCVDQSNLRAMLSLAQLGVAYRDAIEALTTARLQDPDSYEEKMLPLREIYCNTTRYTQLRADAVVIMLDMFNTSETRDLNKLRVFINTRLKMGINLRLLGAELSHGAFMFLGKEWRTQVNQVSQRFLKQALLYMRNECPGLEMIFYPVWDHVMLPLSQGHRVNVPLTLLKYNRNQLNSSRRPALDELLKYRVDIATSENLLGEKLTEKIDGDDDIEDIDPDTAKRLTDFTIGAPRCGIVSLAATLDADMTDADGEGAASGVEAVDDGDDDDANHEGDEGEYDQEDAGDEDEEMADSGEEGEEESDDDFE